MPAARAGGLSQVTTLGGTSRGAQHVPGDVHAAGRALSRFCRHAGKACYEANRQMDILSLTPPSVIGCFWLGPEGIFHLQVILTHQVEWLRSVEINC